MLRSTPVAIGIYDPSSGRAAVLAGVTNSAAVLVSSNRVLFPHAFQENGLCASVLYTISAAAFSQDVLIEGHFDPADYSFPSASRLQIFSEIYGDNNPEQIERPIVRSALQNSQSLGGPTVVLVTNIDHLLDFGEFVLGAGRVRLVGTPESPTNVSVAVVKEFQSFDNRRFIVESLDLDPIVSILQQLPACGSQASLRLKPRFETASVGRQQIPHASAGRDRSAPLVRVALGSPLPRAVAADYIATINGLNHPTVFKSDVTYFVSSPVICNGPVILEAATFKFPNATLKPSNRNATPVSSYVQINNVITCKTSEYFPATFTSADDESSGDSLADSCNGNGCFSTIDPNWNGFIDATYGSPALLISCPSASVSNVRVRYAQEAIRFDGSTALGGTPYTLADSQIIDCRTALTLTGTLPAQSGGGGDQSAIARRHGPGLLARAFEWAGGVAFCNGPPPQPGQPYNININNCLFTTNPYPVNIVVPVNASFTQCTFDEDPTLTRGPLVSSTSPSNVTTPSATFVNCIFANIATSSSGLVTLLGGNNGFYSGFAAFGTAPKTASGYPFQTSGPWGGHYVADSQFLGTGNPAIATSLLNDLTTRSTQPPTTLDDWLDVTGKLTLYPHVPRYVAGPPDLGYYYPVLDYIYSTVVVDDAGVNIEPGTAIGMANGMPGDYEWNLGFVVCDNANIVAHGTPASPITFTSIRAVHEGPFVPGMSEAFAAQWYFRDSAPDPLAVPASNLSFRFCNLWFPAQEYIFCSGRDFDTLVGCSSVYLSLQDCAVHGGVIHSSVPAVRSGPPGSASLRNTLFDRSAVLLDPTTYGNQNPEGIRTPEIDFQVQVYNNLFRGGSFSIEPSPSFAGDWMIRDNLFDKVGFVVDGFFPIPLDHDYNAYWPWLSTDQDPEWNPAAEQARLPVLGSSDEDYATGAPHDLNLAAAPAYQSSALGDWYLPASSPTVNAGSRGPGEAGLFQYTTRTDQVKDGGQAMVNVGLHFVAAVSGQPASSLVAGVPDYIADANGNGAIDANEFPTITTPTTKANNDAFTVTQGTQDDPLSVEDNDSNSAGFPLTVVFPPANSVGTATPHGTMKVDPQWNQILYTPTAGQNSDTFTYEIVNDFNQVSSASASVFVNPSGHTPPAAVNYQLTMLASATAIQADLRSGYSSPGSMSVVYLGTPLLGTLQNIGTGVIEYDRPANIAGADTFKYAVTDGNGETVIGTVTIDRDTGGNAAPVAISYSTTVLKDRSIVLNLPAYDPEGQPLSYNAQQPQHGTLASTTPPQANQRLYTPANGFYGADFFDFSVSDGSLSSAPARVAIHVQQDNLPPRLFGPENYAYTTYLNAPVMTPLWAWDLDGDYLTYSFDHLSTQGGTITGVPPYVTYTPPVDFEGYDSFNFTVTDGKSDPIQGSIQVTVTRQQIVYLSGTQNNYVFRSDMTYELWDIDNPVTLNGTTTIEGGTVIKFAYNDPEAGHPGARLLFNGNVACDTSPWRMAVLTAVDDDTVGAILPESWGDPGGAYYATEAIEISPTAGSTELKWLRIAHASNAVHYLPGSGLSDSLRHIQFLICQNGIVVDGTPSGSASSRELAVGNCLFSGVMQPFAGSGWTARGEQLTLEVGNALAPDPASATYVLRVTNSIFAGWGGLTPSDPASNPNLDGDSNGFDGTSPRFGVNQLVDSGAQSPFAPVPDPTTGFSLANFQGHYYPRAGSPFVGAGVPVISSPLQAELARTTTIMPEVLTNDMVTSQTLAPTIPRETFASPPTLGYHYPVVDYVMNGATINNCTLNIDQGVVIAYTAPSRFPSTPVYEWGLRLNPGARLNVNGYPTNRVVFCHLNNIQEYPAYPLNEVSGPLITFKGVILPSGTPISPYPEARFHFADFFTPAGKATHFGPLTGDNTYDMVNVFELDSCLVQGGVLAYETGGAPGRNVNLHNTIFERSLVAFQDQFSLRGNNEETLLANNNLFWNSELWLTPASGGSPGANWTFIDNIFDNASFHGPAPYHGTGPVAVNDNNAYVNMTTRLYPTAPTSTDPNLAWLSYQSGPLGRFYLPSDGSGPLLLDHGSRSAGAAGLYHYTSLVSNTKEQNSTVNIGPAYVALVNGVPADSNSGGPDGVPDFLADRNGDGNEDAEEMPWTSQNTSGLALLPMSYGPMPSGVIRLNVNLGAGAQDFESVSALVDGQPLPGCSVNVPNPALSCAQVEVDTRCLADGTHELSVYGSAPARAASDGIGWNLASQPLMVGVANNARFPHWDGRADVTLNVNVDTSAGTYILNLFACDYAKSYNPVPPQRISGTSADGVIRYSGSTADLGFGDGDANPLLYAAAEVPDAQAAGGRSAQATPGTYGDPPWAGGDWTLAYTDDTVDYAGDKNHRLLDPLNVGNPAPYVDRPWVHYWNLGGWGRCASLMQASIKIALPSPDGTAPQTCPIRYLSKDKIKGDQDKLLEILADRTVRNFEGNGHGSYAKFLGISDADFAGVMSNKGAPKGMRGKRLRFAFLDGCNTSWSILKWFGADDTEWSNCKTEGQIAGVFGPVLDDYYRTSGRRPSLFLGWNTTIKYAFLLTQVEDDPTIHQPCTHEHYDWISQWHAEFLNNWENNNLDALAAIRTADLTLENLGYPQDILVQDIVGVTRSFNFRNCLVLCGYGNLRFTAYNDGSIMH